MTASERTRVIALVAENLAQRRVGHPLRVAVDGITAAGKSTLAAELVGALSAYGRAAVHLSTDDFHHPRARRYRQGRESARGYYEDSYDFATFRRDVLEPLGPGGTRRYRPASLDLETDETVHPPVAQAAPDAIVVVDGSFLQVPALAAAWDEVVFVDTTLAIARERGSRRDAQSFGGVEAAADALDRRYHAAARIYLDEVPAQARATVVIGNDDLDHPVLRRIGGAPDAGAPSPRPDSG
jgi:uridine kinase